MSRGVIVEVSAGPSSLETNAVADKLTSGKMLVRLEPSGSYMDTTFLDAGGPCAKKCLDFHCTVLSVFRVGVNGFLIG